MDTLRRTLLAAMLLIAASLPLAAAADPQGSAASSVTLSWTAPGDDDYVGVAAGYDLRYSLSPITPENFEQAVQVGDVPSPRPAGVRQKVKVHGLEANRRYYFALRSVDDAGNRSMVSNVPYKTAPEASATSAQPQLSLAAPSPSPSRERIRLGFTLPSRMFVHIKVFDVSGREVKTLAYDTYEAGTTTLPWNLNKEDGIRLGVGQYWIKALLGDQTLTQRLTIIP